MKHSPHITILLTLVLLLVLIAPVAAQNTPFTPIPDWFPRSEAEAVSIVNGVSPQLVSRAGEPTLYFTVKNKSDVPDAVLGDGKCATTAGVCTLRAAIQESNARAGYENISIRAGTYVLTAGELLISGEVGIFGAAFGADTIIDGGGTSRVFNVSSTGNLFLSAAVVTNGSAATGAGLLNDGAVYLRGVTFNNNTATGGGAVENNTGKYVSINNSTLHGNTTTTGAIHNAGILEAQNVTTGFNTAIGIAVASTGNTTIVHGTVDDMIYVSAGGSVSLQNTILSGCTGTVTSLGGNIFESAAGCTYTADPSDTVGDPGLGTFGDNGGNVKTFPLVTGSIALDRITTLATCATTDARYVYRTSGNCDTGAFEYAPALTLFNPGLNTTVNNPFIYVGWTGGTNDPAKGNLVKYKIKMRGATSFIATVKPATNCNSSVCEYFRLIPTLPKTGIMEWRVIAVYSKNGVITTSASVWQQFNVQVPFVPVLYGNDVVNDSTPDLTWYHSLPNIYKVVVQNVQNPNSPVVVYSKTFRYGDAAYSSACSTDTNMCTVTLPATLTEGVAYRWRVQATEIYQWVAGGVLNKRIYSAKSAWKNLSYSSTAPAATAGEGWMPLPSGD